MPWLALALVLVVGGGLLVGLLVQSAADRSTVLAAARTIAPGQVITNGDLRVVDVGVDGEASLVPATSRSSIVGKVAVVGIPEGALLSPGQVAAVGGIEPGTVVVGALLAPGELPVSTLRAGDAVALVAVTGGQGADRESLGTGTVFTTTAGTQTGSVFVSLVVGEEIAEQVADVASQQRLRLLLLPAGAGE
jgi:alkylated DNA nucleotide flippase Atl1